MGTVGHGRWRPGAVLISAYAAVKPYTWQCYDRGSFRGVWQKPRSAPVYSAMIERQEPHDPLVTEPSLMLDRHPVILAIDPETAQRTTGDGGRHLKSRPPRARPAAGAKPGGPGGGTVSIGTRL